jgi:hypothetical protein
MECHTRKARLIFAAMSVFVALRSRKEKVPSAEMGQMRGGALHLQTAPYEEKEFSRTSFGKGVWTAKRREWPPTFLHPPSPLPKPIPCSVQWICGFCCMPMPCVFYIIDLLRLGQVPST